MGIAARPGKGNGQPDGKLGRVGTGRIDAVKPEKLIAMLNDAINDIFDQDLYDELITQENEERELFQAELKRYVENDL